MGVIFINPDNNNIIQNKVLFWVVWFYRFSPVLPFRSPIQTHRAFRYFVPYVLRNLSTITLRLRFFPKVYCMKPTSPPPLPPAAAPPGTPNEQHFIVNTSKGGRGKL